MDHTPSPMRNPLRFPAIPFDRGVVERGAYDTEVIPPHEARKLRVSKGKRAK